MYKIVSTAVENKSLCEIYTNRNDVNKFAVGYIMNCDGNNFIYKSLDKYGNIDGYVCESMDRVYSLITGTKYLKNLENLYNEFGIKCENIDIDNSDLLIKCLNLVWSEKALCTLELFNEDYVVNDGMIIDIDVKAGVLKFNLIDENSEFDGVAVYNIDDINSIMWNSNDNIKHARLIKINNK